MLFEQPNELLQLPYPIALAPAFGPQELDLELGCCLGLLRRSQLLLKLAAPAPTRRRHSAGTPVTEQCLLVALQLLASEGVFHAVILCDALACRIQEG